LAIVDEQHRFGVMQRFRLMKKPAEGAAVEAGTASPAAPPEPDVVVMTATPIPRTLALTLYGDLDVSVIDELPPGRTPIVTRRVSDERSEEVWEFVRKQIRAGHQAYIVYPVIDEQGTGQTDGWEPSPSSPPSPASAEGDRDNGSRAAVRGSSAKAKSAPAARQQSLWAGLKAAVQMHERLRREAFSGMRMGLLHGRKRRRPR
jgi:ATP-dependent DNA helicase RecG